MSCCEICKMLCEYKLVLASIVMMESLDDYRRLESSVSSSKLRPIYHSMYLVYLSTNIQFTYFYPFVLPFKSLGRKFPV